MTSDPEIMSWSILFPRTWTPTNWPPQTLNDLADIWVVFTISVALGLLLWAILRTGQVWIKTDAYLKLSKRLAADSNAITNRSAWIAQANCPLARDFNDLLVEVPKKGSPLDKELKRCGSASEIFTTMNLGAGIVGSRLLMATPAILTGLGVLGTFVGLAMGIGGLDLGSQNINNLNQSIAPLIQGCSTAFITSVWGVFASIVFAVLEKALEWLAVKRIQHVQEAFDSLLPRYIPEESMLTLQGSSLEMEARLNGLAVAIGDAMQKAIDRIGNSITEAVQKSLGDGAKDLAGKSAEMMATALTDQLAKLEDSMKAISDKFHSEFVNASDQLKATITEFESVVSGIDETVKVSQVALNSALERLSAHESIVKRMEDSAKSLAGASEKLNEMRDAFSESAERNAEAANAQKQAASMNEAVAQKFDLVAEKLPEVQQSLTDNAQIVSALWQPLSDLKEVLSTTPDVFKKQAEDQAERDEHRSSLLLNQTENLVNAVANAAGQFTKIESLATSLTSSAEELKVASASLEELSKNMNNTSDLYAAAAYASEKAASAGERAANKLEPIPESLKVLTESLSHAGAKIKLGVDSSNGIYLQLINYQKQWFDGVKLGLTSMRDQLQMIIDQYGNSVSEETHRHMDTWTKAVNESLSRFASQVEALEGGISDLEETIEEFKAELGN
jgi:methyl-accepting chemotaxis protein